MRHLIGKRKITKNLNRIYAWDKKRPEKQIQIDNSKRSKAYMEYIYAGKFTEWMINLKSMSRYVSCDIRHSKRHFVSKLNMDVCWKSSALEYRSCSHEFFLIINFLLTSPFVPQNLFRTMLCRTHYQHITYVQLAFNIHKKWNSYAFDFSIRRVRIRRKKNARRRN